jgi:hypothetical protein
VLDETKLQVKVWANRLAQNAASNVFGGLRHLVRPAEIAPIIVVGAKAENFIFRGSDAKITVDDRESAVLSYHGNKARRNDVDSRKSKRLRIL